MKYNTAIFLYEDRLSPEDKERYNLEFKNSQIWDDPHSFKLWLVKLILGFGKPKPTIIR